jgi:hypothetical protein
MADELSATFCGKVEKTEQFERVPDSIARVERFTEEWLDPR